MPEAYIKIIQLYLHDKNSYNAAFGAIFMYFESKNIVFEPNRISTRSIIFGLLIRYIEAFEVMYLIQIKVVDGVSRRVLE